MILLDEVKRIKSEYDIIAKYTAINFNVFEILGVGTREVRLHSNFLAELLNPKGAHMQGNIFLKTFLQEVLKWEDFDIEKVIVAKECGTGYINGDYSEGGNIDFLISNNSQGIIIENKIYAEDQEKQLLGYYNFGMKTFKFENNFRLLYLSLEGDQPSENSMSGINHYTLVSYHTDIVKWLEKCLVFVYDFPLVFALLRQYLNHIKSLTNQSISKKMEQDIINKNKLTK